MTTRSKSPLNSVTTRIQRSGPPRGVVLASSPEVRFAVIRHLYRRHCVSSYKQRLGSMDRRADRPRTSAADVMRLTRRHNKPMPRLGQNRIGRLAAMEAVCSVESCLCTLTGERDMKKALKLAVKAGLPKPLDGLIEKLYAWRGNEPASRTAATSYRTWSGPMRSSPLTWLRRSIST